MKRLKAATHPVIFCICLRSFGISNCDRARILAEFASIPLLETMKPRSFPAGTPKTHFSGLSLMSYVRRLSNVSLKWSTKDSTCLEKQIGKIVEAYVDDVVVKTKHVESLIDDLRLTFDNLQTYDIKLNLEKCVFRVPAGKLMGFIVSSRGIEANPAKIRALSQLATPTDLKQIQKLTRCVVALSRFISHLGEGISPLSPPSAHRTLRVDGRCHSRIGRNKGSPSKQPNPGRNKCRRTNAVVHCSNSSSRKRSARRRTRSCRA